MGVMRIERSVFILSLFLLACSVFSEERKPDSVFSLGVFPCLSIPLGDDAELFALGGGADVSAQLRLIILPRLSANILLES